MLKNSKVIYILTVFFLMATPSYSNPIIENIEGSAKSGEGLLLIGDLFGSNPNPLPIINEDFEEGNDGDFLDATGKWIKTDAQGHNSGIFSTQNPRTGTQSALWEFRVEDENFRHDWYQKTDDYEQLYATFWLWWDDVTGDSGIYKGCRFNSDTKYSGAPRLGISGYTSETRYKPYSWATGSDTSFIASEWIDHGQWVRTEMYFKLSDPGVENSEVMIDHIGHARQEVSGFMSRDENEGDKYLNIFYLGQAVVRGDTDGEIYMDDLYVSNTRARVEIGNNSVFEECTHREIQVINTWLDEEIEVTFNQGSFMDHEDVFLFVVDADGNVSNGYPVNLGDNAVNLLPPEKLNISQATAE